MHHFSIEVDNLKCTGCATTICKKIASIKGVKGVSVDISSSSVKLTLDDSESFDSAMKKLIQLGYPPKGTSTTGQKVKSFVSCATGKLYSLEN